jgi:hypothetical protein
MKYIYIYIYIYIYNTTQLIKKLKLINLYSIMLCQLLILMIYLYIYTQHLISSSL